MHAEERRGYINYKQNGTEESGISCLRNYKTFHGRMTTEIMMI